ncbi:HET-domain-containing protein, partial [Acephala macrosclerotiorum]
MSGNAFHRELPKATFKELNLPSRYLTCIAQARYWLGKCISHSTCHRNPSHFVPKRLVCINPSDPTILHLSTKDEIPPDAQYMTLSHCWGQSQTYRLLRENYEKLRSSINFHELPKNFRDAVLVAWGLNTFYLWIDSLCIIQDSLFDWQQESAAMAEIYSHGLTNICATGASDGDCGLFLDRQLPSFPNLNLKLRLSDGGTAQTYHTADLKMWRDGVEQSPLISRAWVLQERFLSHSNIHFGQTQMFWECSAGCTLETYTARFLSDKYTSISRKTNFSATDSFPSVKPGSDGDQGKELWNQVVESYSSCALTNDTDRLVALSGIASKFANFLVTSFSKPNDPFIPSYFAGIWNCDIINQLLWQRMTDNPVLRPNRYIAPTWSWASVD